MKIFLLTFTFFLALLPGTVLAWNLSDHREMSRLALKDVDDDWGLNEPCDVRPLSSFLDKLRKLRPEIADSWQFSNYLKINPKVDIGTVEDKKLTPREILSLYATDPDDGRDQDLFVRDEKGNPKPMFPDQKWFGAIQGPNSQAFRHIEKPPFRLGAPLQTLGLPLRAIGEASERAEIYFQLSQLAFSLGEDYWGWRFLAGGLHYIQDLHQPYHAGQITPLLMRQGSGILFSWGWKAKGFMGSFAHVISNSHRFFETYVDRPEGRDRGAKAQALKALGGTDLLPFPGTVRDMARGIRDTSNVLYAPLAQAIDTMTGGSLADRAEFYSDGDDNAANNDPKDFLKESPQFEDANQEVFAIVQDRFASAGRAIRAYVREAVEERKETPQPEALLETLDALVGPSNSGRETE